VKKKEKFAITLKYAVACLRSPTKDRGHDVNRFLAGVILFTDSERDFGI
jgi:hypothetical protein